MTHARQQRQLSAYLDGELTAQETEEVRAHLADCATCRAELAQLRSVKTLLGRLPERSAPQDLWASLRTRVDQPAENWIASVSRIVRKSENSDGSA